MEDNLPQPKCRYCKTTMKLTHCHSVGDHDAWFYCPQCKACSPNATGGTYDENSIKAYLLAIGNIETKV